jgi:hypothetical protein
MSRRGFKEKIIGTCRASTYEARGKWSPVKTLLGLRKKPQTSVGKGDREMMLDAKTAPNSDDFAPAARDPRFGSVRTYPESVLRDYFGDILNGEANL